MEDSEEKVSVPPIFFFKASGGNLSFRLTSFGAINTGSAMIFPPFTSRLPVIAIRMLIARMAPDELVCWSRAFLGLMHAGFVVAYTFIRASILGC